MIETMQAIVDTGEVDLRGLRQMAAIVNSFLRKSQQIRQRSARIRGMVTHEGNVHLVL